MEHRLRGDVSRAGKSSISRPSKPTARVKRVMRPNVSLGGVIEHPVPSNRRETLLSSGVVCLATGAMVLLEDRASLHIHSRGGGSDDIRP